MRSIRVPSRCPIAPPRKRIPAFDYLRAFVIFLVVLHHAVMAYCTGGHAARGGDYTNATAPVVDPAQWDGFNLMVMGNDSFFMPLMFLLAGLFVRPSLARKGLGRYLADRALRLGVPLLVGIVTVVPLSYYASYLQSGGTADFAAFWARMVTAGPWPSGPLWFVGALLVFDTATALILSRDPVRLGVRRLLAALDRRPKVVWFAAFLRACGARLPAGAGRSRPLAVADRRPVRHPGEPHRPLCILLRRRRDRGRRPSRGRSSRIVGGAGRCSPPSRPRCSSPCTAPLCRPSRTAR